MENNPQIILASASPRRRELLDQIGVRYAVLPVDIDESVRPGESPEAFVERLALEKARAGFERQKTALPSLGSDTIVLLDNDILGKPASAQDGQRMLSSLSGQMHEVLTAVALVNSELSDYRLSRSKVYFRPMDEAEIRAYWDTGEPCDKAGAYGIQGLAAQFIQRLDGSYSGVMGLPLFETAELLKKFGIRMFP
ncbi:MAG: Maf-like protein [Gammaproteobacteria bacterium]|nr:Maf-like protein [Gammaproteobacteria bacterium]